jgi:gas vesicle protein
MASRERAIVNNLNERARFYGQSDELTIEDVRGILHFFDYKSCKSGEMATSLDHVKPLALGGENKVENIQVLTVNENKQKGDEEIDYRKGRICTPEYIAEFLQDGLKDKRIKHDWMQLEHEYITTNCSQRDLSAKHSIDPATIGHYASTNNWAEKRQQFVSETSARVQEIVSQSRAENNIAALDLCDSIVSQFMQEMAKGKAKVTASDAIAAARFRSVLNGGIDSRREEVVKDWRDYAKDLGVNPQDVIAEFERVAASHEPGRETDHRPSGIGEEETGAGWTD